MTATPKAAWKHGVYSTPLITSAWLYAGAGLTSAPGDVGLHPLGPAWIAAGTGAAVITAAASRMKRTRSWARTAFTAAWVGGAGSWLTFTAATTPWSMTALGSLAGATAAMIPMYALERHSRADQITAQWAAEKNGGMASLSGWEQAFTTVGLKGITTGEPVLNRGGYVLPLRFAPDGSGSEELAPLLRRLERAKGDLRRGSLTLRDGEYAAEAELHVSTADVLAEMLPLPSEDHPLTINEPLTLGMLESGDPIEVLFRENSLYLVGMRGSGKSITLQVIISLLTRCVDCVIWMIDLAGGNTAKRWLVPWLEGRKRADGTVIDRPILDWVATTESEALRILNSALAIADDRANSMRGGKIKPTADLPAIYVISDENSDLMAWSAAARQPKTRLIKKGRKAAIDIIDAVQRGTGPNSGGGEISSQYDSTIGMKVNKKAETQYIFPDHYGRINLAALPGKGATFLKLSGWPDPLPGRFYFVDDDEDSGHIEALATARADLRPDLDTRAQQVAAQYGYADRWSDEDRIAWLVDAYSDGAPTPKVTAQAPAARTLLTPIRPVSDYLNKPAEEEPVPGAAELIAEIETELARHAVDLGKTPPDRTDPRRGDVTRFVAAAGLNGIKVNALMAALEAALGDRAPARAVVQRWLRQEVDEGRMRQPGLGYYATNQEN